MRSTREVAVNSSRGQEHGTVSRVVVVEDVIGIFDTFVPVVGLIRSLPPAAILLTLKVNVSERTNSRLPVHQELPTLTLTFGEGNLNNRGDEEF